MKFLAGTIMALGGCRLIIISVATFMNLGTASERINDRGDAIIILVLGSILWQITQLLRQKGQ